MAGADGHGGHHLAPLGVHAPGDPHLGAAGGSHGQVDRLDAGRRAVVQGGIGHVGAEQSTDQGLVLEEGLEHALGHFGLVGRVGGDELRPVGQPVHRRGYVVVVGAGPGEADQVGPDGAVGRRVGVEATGHVGLGQPVGHVEAARQAESGGHHIEQLLDRRQAQGRQHLGHLGIGVGDEVHAGLSSGGG